MKKFKLLSLLTVFAVFSVNLVALVLPSSVEAASLTDVSAALSPDTTSTLTTATLTFTPNTAVSDQTVLEISYDSLFTGGASLTDADVTVTGTNITSSTEADFAAGYFTSTLTTSANVTTEITVTIGGTNQLTTPANPGNYNFSVTADIGGAGTTYDTGAGLAYVADDNDVTVTAVVPPVISLIIYEPGVDTETNTCDLGVLSLNNVKTCQYDVATGTNNTAGVSLNINSDGPLDSVASGGDIDACSGTNCDGADATAGVTAGSEEYGVFVSDNGGGEYTVSGSFGTDSQALPTTETLLASSSTTGDGTSATNFAERLEVTHSASMNSSTLVANDYNQEVIYTAFTN
jgi:hypothetical protein